MRFNPQDFYFKKAKKEKFLARSVYKLEEIDKKHSILSPGKKVLDLGYYPGSWIQYTSQKIGANGHVVGVDIQEVNTNLVKNSQNVTLMCKSIFDIENVNDLNQKSFFDVILSDMAPKTTGTKLLDQMNSLELVQKVFNMLPILLRPQGDVVIKVFESHDFQVYYKEIKSMFNKVSLFRPKSTRTQSKEIFLIAKNFKGQS